MLEDIFVVVVVAVVVIIKTGGATNDKREAGIVWLLEDLSFLPGMNEKKTKHFTFFYGRLQMNRLFGSCFSSFGEWTDRSAALKLK